MRGEPRRILVVEDESSIREAVLTYLRHLGYEAEGAENGIEGLDCVRNKRYDLIILDIKMPYLDGRQLSESMAEMDNPAPILVITAWDDRRPLRQEAGRLIKSFTLHMLQEQVARILGGHPPGTSTRAA